MRILPLDLGKYKTVACDYEAETAKHRFVTVVTTAKALHDLMMDREPDRVVIEICSIAARVSDLVQALGINCRWPTLRMSVGHRRRVKQKNVRGDALNLAQLSR